MQNNHRQLKFRVWDKESKCWFGCQSHDWVGTGIGNVGGPDIQPWKCMSLKGEIMSNDNMGGFVDSNQNNYIIQQFTGLKDKNEKEIYEGDIIKYDIANYITSIIWSEEDSAFITKSKEGGGFINPNRMLNYEIIGNICETSELLKN